ncbi:choline/carnitine/betaine transport [Corynebacterium kutscheri]|uniref:Choline/carnitine/betaine transport n=1 Tax=Corynebacterium kutscheri TaxID=35755 RepID=A0A0F6R2S6_9CORY|nr:BCCT family transporter [Corynebacterium kutscheri]AKE41823.1 choline/carnitine/betaine transport [Corynebacterium kutscheri]VEH04292.1 Glycine betaine transporter [Corynebacterium kutscheri]VEH10151.1 Glycine betaine transporter [Corynebacterium kutscheri]
MTDQEKPQEANSDTSFSETTATEQLATMLAGREVIEEHAAQPEEEIIYEGEDEDAKIDFKVAIPAVAIVLGVVIWGLLAGDSFSTFASTGLSWVVTNLGWAFILFSSVFLFFAIALAVSNFGTIKLGRTDEAPEFSTVSWIAMMFAAGMGIGLMFYGVAEPLNHYLNGVPGHDANNVGQAMSATLLHWTLHPWAIYGIFGLAIAYSTFRLGRRQLLSSAFTPLLGERGAKGWPGRIIDILAIVATIFGTACSLGVGATQISAGLTAAGIVENPAMGTIIAIVAVLTLAFLLSAMSGVGKGIQYVSNANMILAAILAIFVFIVGPTVSILNFIPGSIGAYLSNFFEMIGRTAESANGSAGDFLSSWTIFYWAWWISWSPFVGMFLARISRGRTIREFLFGVILVPSVVSVVWFAIFGGTAIHLEQKGRSIYGDGSAANQLFALLHEFPGGQVMGVVAVILLGTFFVTSADSASTVMGSMSQGGQTDANKYVSAMWGALVAVIGVVMLVSGGDNVLSNLQNITIVAATPFLLVIFLLMFAILQDLRNDEIYLDYREQQRFASRLARERRIHIEHEKRERAKKRRQQQRTQKHQKNKLKA